MIWLWIRATHRQILRAAGSDDSKGVNVVSFPARQSHDLLPFVEADAGLPSSSNVVAECVSDSFVGDEGDAVDVVPVFDDDPGHILTHWHSPGIISSL